MPNIPHNGKQKYLVDLLRYIECFWRFAIPQEISKLGPNSGLMLKSRALNAAGVALSLCCKEQLSAGGSPWTIEETTEDEMSAWKCAFDQSLRYSDMCDWMYAMWNDFCAIHQISPSEFQLSYLDQDRKRLEVADWLLRKLEAPVIQAAIDVSFLSTEIQRAGVLDATLSLRIPMTSLQRVKDWVSATQAACWTLEGPIPLDQFELAEFKTFWTALSTVAAVHKFAWMSGAPDSQLAVSVPVLNTRELQVVLSQLSGIPNDRIQFLLNYFTCESDRWKNGNSQDAVLQPVYVVGNERALSPTLILESNAERNILDLVNQKNSKAYDKVKDLKEAEWSAELESMLRRYGLKSKAQVKYEDTAMDLLIVDETRSFGITCELKWILLPDRFKKGNVEYISKGFEQSLRACKWAASHKDEVAEKLSLSSEALQNCEFRPLLMCKNTLLAGLATHDEVPISCNRIFDWFIQRTEGDIKKFWNMVNEKAFLPTEGKHFQERESRLEFNGITFNVTGFDEVPGIVWTPENVIPLN